MTSPVTLVVGFDRWGICLACGTRHWVGTLCPEVRPEADRLIEALTGGFEREASAGQVGEGGADQLVEIDVRKRS